MRPYFSNIPFTAFFGLTIGTGILVAVLKCHETFANADGDPIPPPLGRTSSEEPTFDRPEQGTQLSDEEFFNHFSWQDFISQNGPAASDKRGQPHATKGFGDLTAKQTVWESYKSLDELFPDDPRKNPPSEWDSHKVNLSIRYADANRKEQRFTLDALSGSEAGRTKLLQQFARLDNIGQPLFPGVIGSPLVTQRKTYVMFETRINRKAYDFVKENRYFLRDNLPKPPHMMEFPDQSIHVKAAWMELPDDEATRNRFYRTTATIVVDWTADAKPVIAQREVGLVGLHIVHKTPKRQDWVWSTFEHVDNLLAEHGGGAPPASFSSQDPALASSDSKANNPKPEPLASRKPYPKADDRKPVEVVRVNPISETTKNVNRFYQSHPKIKDTVWANYKLVGTQWPRLGLPTRPTASSPNNAENRLPKNLANATMETYIQKASCLGCHASANPGEFVFYPQVRAYPPAE